MLFDACPQHYEIKKIDLKQLTKLLKYENNRIS